MTKPLKALWLHACWLIMTDWSTYQSDMLKVRKWHFYEHLLQYILSKLFPLLKVKKKLTFFPGNMELDIEHTSALP